MNKRHIQWILATFILAVLLFTTGVHAFANANANPDAAARKIVVFQDWVANDAAKDNILDKTGAIKIKHLPIINAAVVLAGPASEKALQKQAEVLRVDTDAVVHMLPKPEKPPKPTPTPTPTPPAEVLPWGVDRIDAELVHPTNKGTGVKVAVIDTGIDLDHPDLQANMKGGVNTINTRKSADDDNGHGTHVAGIIAGVDNDIGVLGVAPEAWLYAVKVLNRNGSGFTSDIIEGVQWCIDNDIEVANMSLGTSSDVQSFHDALIIAYNNGVVLIASAGNSGPGENTVLYPAKYNEVIAVSATDSNDAIPSWSSRGTQVELAAPGVDIYSTYKDADYKTLSGTSMAAPHVSGTAALVIASGITDSNNNGLINDEVRQRMVDTAEDLGTQDNLYGSGLVDAEKAATNL